jgi:putative transposase
VWQRGREGATVAGLIHHSDRGVQYLSIRYTQRLAEIGAVASVGSVADSFDNAAAESLIRRGPWRGLDQVELATLEWVDWFNHRRLHSAAANAPPAEFEEQYYRHNRDLEVIEAEQLSLH